MSVIKLSLSYVFHLTGSCVRSMNAVFTQPRSRQEGKTRIDKFPESRYSFVCPIFVIGHFTISVIQISTDFSYWISLVWRVNVMNFKLYRLHFPQSFLFASFLSSLCCDSCLIRYLLLFYRLLIVSTKSVDIPVSKWAIKADS